MHVDDRVQVRRVLVDFLLDHGWNLCIESYFAPERLNIEQITNEVLVVPMRVQTFN